MIQSFKDVDTRRLFEARANRRWEAIAKVALRKLDQIQASINLNDLRVPPGNHLEALKGNRFGQHSIRNDDQWRIGFVWTDAGAEEVEIVDYH